MRKLIKEINHGVSVIMGTSWPIDSICERISVGKKVLYWLNTYSICNGSVYRTEKFRTKKAALFALDVFAEGNEDYD